MITSNLLTTIFAFLLTLGLVVIVHELGHFLFCKVFGVYVKTFSIGIGPKFARVRWGETEYVLSLIPFGGYVKMAGEGLMEEIQDTGTWEERKYPLGTEAGNQEAAGQDDDIPHERRFCNRPAWQRGIIFVAGPLFNLILAFVLFTWLALVSGLSTIPFTTVGSVRDGSPGAEAGLLVGDKIISVDNQSVATWYDVEVGLVPLELRDEAEVPSVQVVIGRDGHQQTLTVWPNKTAEGQWNVGIKPWDTTVGLVQNGGPADKLGLREGDYIVSVGGEPVTTFEEVRAIITAHAEQDVEIHWLRDGKPMSGTVVPDNQEVAPGVFEGRIALERYSGKVDVGLMEAAAIGYSTTYRTGKSILVSLGELVRGKHGLDALGGPVRIGQAAGEHLRWGFSRLMFFVAFFSMNLFLLNLMPIPVLDGGHVLFLFFEVIRGGRPVPERLQAIATQMGLIILLLFMTFVVVLDVWKVTGH